MKNLLQDLGVLLNSLSNTFTSNDVSQAMLLDHVDFEIDTKVIPFDSDSNEDRTENLPSDLTHVIRHKRVRTRPSGARLCGARGNGTTSTNGRRLVAWKLNKKLPFPTKLFEPNNFLKPDEMKYLLGEASLNQTSPLGVQIRLLVEMIKEVADFQKQQVMRHLDVKPWMSIWTVVTIKAVEFYVHLAKPEDSERFLSGMAVAANKLDQSRYCMKDYQGPGKPSDSYWLREWETYHYGSKTFRTRDKIYLKTDPEDRNRQVLRFEASIAKRRNLRSSEVQSHPSIFTISDVEPLLTRLATEQAEKFASLLSKLDPTEPRERSKDDLLLLIRTCLPKLGPGSFAESKLAEKLHYPPHQYRRADAGEYAISMRMMKRLRDRCMSCFEIHLKPPSKVLVFYPHGLSEALKDLNSALIKTWSRKRRVSEHRSILTQGQWNSLLLDDRGMPISSWLTLELDAKNSFDKELKTLDRIATNTSQSTPHVESSGILTTSSKPLNLNSMKNYKTSTAFSWDQLDDDPVPTSAARAIRGRRPKRDYASIIAALDAAIKVGSTIREFAAQHAISERTLRYQRRRSLAGAI